MATGLVAIQHVPTAFSATSANFFDGMKGTFRCNDKDVGPAAGAVTGTNQRLPNLIDISLEGGGLIRLNLDSGSDVEIFRLFGGAACPDLADFIAGSGTDQVTVTLQAKYS